MKIRVSFLWLFLLIAIAYDCAVVALGWFSHRGLAARLDADLNIALFIFSAWVAHKIVIR